MKDRFFVNQSLLGMEGKEYPSQAAAVAAMKQGDVLHVHRSDGNYRHMTKDYLDHMEKMLQDNMTAWAALDNKKGPQP